MGFARPLKYSTPIQERRRSFGSFRPIDCSRERSHQPVAKFSATPVCTGNPCTSEWVGPTAETHVSFRRVAATLNERLAEVLEHAESELSRSVRPTSSNTI